MENLIDEALYYQFGVDLEDEIDGTDHYHKDSLAESRSSDGISMAEEAFMLGYEDHEDYN